MFSAADAAFSGFRAGREHVRSLLVWIVVFGLAGMAATVFMISTMGPQLAALQALGQQASPDTAAMGEAVNQVAPFFGPIFLYALFINAVQTAGACRMILRPGDKAFGYLRIGGDELRLLVVTLVMSVIFGLAAMVGIFGVAAIAAVAALANPGLGVLAGFVGGLALAGLLIVLVVRLSLANAQTFATGRINLFGSWAITRGRFWPIFGTYLLAFVLFVIVEVALQAIVMLVVVLLGGGFAGVGAMYRPDMTSVATFFVPAVTIRFGIALVAAPFLSLIMLCPAPEIYRLLAGPAAR